MRAMTTLNPRLTHLQPYPFERLRALLAGVEPPERAPIRLSIGEPQHETPEVIRRALVDHLAGLSVYPTTIGMDALREAIAAWCVSRYRLRNLDPRTQVLPVLGSREALFAAAQVVIDASKPALVACPNPFYQIYEGAALLAGARPAFLNQVGEDGFALRLDALTPDEWRAVQLLYVCSPGNPTGHVLALDDWRRLFELSDEHGFVIASDECYSEIYFDETQPPMGALQAASALGRDDFRRLLVFSSLSKRSNAPGLRSGCVVGDATLMKSFLLYRTYHGCAMSLMVQHASIAAWRDERHVQENRALYRQKFSDVLPIVSSVMDVGMPDAGFYLWAKVPARWQGDDAVFARELFGATHVTVLPGSYLARPAHGRNPGAGFVRLALVASRAECQDAATRLAEFCKPQS